jgi:hypothetical protein
VENFELCFADTGFLADHIVFQYNVFVRATDFQTMASQQSSGTSFESPHNTVHMRSSCGGDMGNPNVAAFDPIL